MRSSAFAVALLAASAVASPIQKARDYVTDIVVVTETVYVTAGEEGGYYHTRTAVKTVIPTPLADPAPSPTEPVVIVTESQAPPPSPEQPQEAPAPTEAAPSAPAPESSPATYVPTGDYATNAVNAHNVHRSNHSVGAVSWDADLANIAGQIAASCNFAHDTTTGGGHYGQNIAAGNPPEEIAKIVSDEWYNSEVNLFPQYGVGTPDMGNFEAWGHFTQVVWKDSNLIGCATQHCPNGVSNTMGGVGPYFTVCNYRNTGNVLEFFDQNVFPPLGQATVTG
ncbi:hypothetical protein FGG08_003020 [Glutinoglossum americanum]|uniref:SCP domain-containing protein n=1 Tax=Glutinoglossum americanum TaxID=1670608 RepID=A0A9P8I865_9PEZI|nr:hypothetical protein FGG08_003020 [Glutinoglossum americanum]